MGKKGHICDGSDFSKSLFRLILVTLDEGTDLLLYSFAKVFFVIALLHAR